MGGAAPTPELLLAEFAGTPKALPEAVRAAGRRSLLNMVGTAIGGAGEAAIDRLAELSSGFGGAATTGLIGRRERADMLWAACINAAAANIFDFDDTHVPTVIHPAAPVGPAVLALAELRAAEGRPVSGSALLEAFVVGMEATCRLGNAAGSGHYARGWHITSTCGIVGAALAAGRLLGLAPPALADALGNALAQAAGSVETLGTMSKSLSVGQAARGGLMAALLAERGFAGPERPLTGRHGFFPLYSDAAEPSRLTDGLGSGWEVLNNTFKPYPCGVVLNPVIEACLALHAEGGFDPAAIVDVELTGHPLLRQRTDRPGVTSGRLAQVSAQHAVAVSLLRGIADLDAFSDRSVADPDLRAFGARLRFHDDPSCSLESARVRLTLADGREIVRSVEAARGGLERPMTDADLAAKLRAQVEWRGIDLAVDELVEAIWGIEDADDGAHFLALARPR
ncbi:MmgE/PrpD family protein [Mesorhizobium marinum]|uniref:MmgE/PrpD family protein n=1 Tax=Mesorhizobium marinum TaxID=3228790 RepID=UPI003465C825